MMWHELAYEPSGVFVSETVNGHYAECYPEAVVRRKWGNSQTFGGYELYPYYAFIAAHGSPVRVSQKTAVIAFGSLEECIAVVEAVLESGNGRLGEGAYRRRDRQFTP